MAALFSKPKTPDPVLPNPLPPPPDRSSDETAALAAEQRQKAAKGGRAFTMLTGGQGASSGAVASRYLGAAART